MKTLVLGRHAKSDWSFDLPDFDRPLNSRGERDAPRMGRLLAEAGFQADLIVSSPANRARSTAEAIAKQIAYQAEIRYERSIYDEGHGNLVGIAQSLPRSVDTAMLFGHNPTMENALSYLLQIRAGIVMPTCALACLEIATSDWKQLDPALISLKWLLIPKLLK